MLKKNDNNMKLPNLLCLFLPLFIISCSSPKSDGQDIAEAENKCAEKCLEAAQNLESSFVNNFNPSDYALRSDAIKDYKQRLQKIGNDYDNNIDEVTIRKAKLKGKYADDYHQMKEFELAYASTVDYTLVQSVTKFLLEDTIPASVIASINRIVPPIPDVEKLKEDLNGHSLNEGFEKQNCYFSEDWKRTIGKDVVLNELLIENIQNSGQKECEMTVTMKLKQDYLNLNACVLVYYYLPDGNDWTINFVKSFGTQVVQTHKFDDCIRTEIADDGWGGINALFIHNTSEVELLVLGHVVTSSGNRKFSTLIPAGEKKQVGGLFGGGNVTNFEIVAVERVS